jgi:glycosyltransferase involved in cell wall biosynthesis
MIDCETGGDTSLLLHVIVISSVRPEPTSAGQIILHRHLVDQPGITLEVYGTAPKRPTLSNLIRRAAARLGRTRLHRFVEDFWVLWAGRWMDSELPKTITAPGRTVVLTVAHGDGFMAAWRFARRHQLPLVAFYQDWWPDIACVHRPVRRLLERRFRQLYSSADVAICVGPGMHDALGPNPSAEVLYPISASIAQLPGEDCRPPGPFKILYSGNLNDYGPMLGDALEASLVHPEILIQVRGNHPAWSADRKATLRENGRWLDFAPRHELDAWLASADAFLVPMVFDPTIRRRMETSFPSKLIEFAQFGKPLIAWGPEYCSAIRWARVRDSALCVTDSSPHALMHELKALSIGEMMRLASKSREAAEMEFSPVLIQQQFLALLHKTVERPASYCR